MKTKYFYLLLIIILVILIIILFPKSYAVEEEPKRKALDLFLYDNGIEQNIYDYIDLIDDSLIPVTTYNISDVLSDNYEVITNFAINFILNHEDYYTKDIKTLNEHEYYKDGVLYKTNKYINKKVFDYITEAIFNQKDYYITNDYIEILNNMVSLLLVDDYSCSLKIEKKLGITVDNNYYIASIKYENNDLIYKFIFEKVGNRLILNNIEV